MNGRLREAVAVCVADLRQRTRTPKLLVVAVLVAYFAKLLVVDSQLRIGEEFTGAGTSAWYGGMIASIGTLVLFVVGFSLVKGSIERDRETGVGELLATSPTSSLGYLTGKFLANVAVLLAVTATLAAAATVAFLLEGTGPFDPVALVVPFVVVTVPPVVLVAAAAVLADTVSPFRGTLGSVVYFVGAMTLFTASTGAALAGAPAPFDVIGYQVLHGSMMADIHAQYPGFSGDLRGFGYTGAEASAREFRWSGVAVTPTVLAGRSPFLGLAAVLLGLAWVSFDRFDPDAGWSLPSFPSFSDFRSGGSDSDGTGTGTPAIGVSSDGVDGAVEPGAVSLPSVDGGGFDPIRTLIGEWRLAVRGKRWWWYLASVLGVVALALAPMSLAGGVVYPLVVLLGLSTWSHLGARERLHRTRELVFTVERPVGHLGATTLAGVSLAVLLTAPLPIRYVLAGATGSLLGWVGAVALLPAAGTALGVWIGRPRVYESLFLTAWYLGPVNGATPLDVLAVHESTVDAGLPVVYVGLAVVCFLVAAVGRRRVVGTDSSIPFLR